MKTQGKENQELRCESCGTDKQYMIVAFILVLLSLALNMLLGVFRYQSLEKDITRIRSTIKVWKQEVNTLRGDFIKHRHTGLYGPIRGEEDIESQS